MLVTAVYRPATVLFRNQESGSARVTGAETNAEIRVYNNTTAEHVQTVIANEFGIVNIGGFTQGVSLYVKQVVNGVESDKSAIVTIQ